ncbi:MAG: alpha-hydroxy acid oxidase [Chloroflexi bacterium]|nr:alpha-hydroxy acid oxidase [Chloroflexota bacterium]
MADFVSTEEIIQLARRRVHQGVWDYLVGGSESETTLRRNRLAFDRLAFRPRVLRDVSSIDTSTTFLGHKLRIPVVLAPVGSLQVFDPEGGVAATRAAAEYGIMHVLSSVTAPTLEETANCVDYPKMFQLYVHGDWAWIEDIIGRVVEADYKALCVTVDVQHYSRRERVMVERWVQPTRRAPRDPYYGAALTWDLMDRIRDLAGLPFMIKGIATVEDALIAVDHGVDVIWVSNHGGRQLDHGLGSMEVLQEIVEAVDGRAEVIVDGGVLRGSDVLKAVALGAKAVAIGKLQAWGLSAAGSDGVVNMLQILEDEMRSAMGLLGVTSMDELGPEFVTKTDAVVTSPHEMSAWVNMPSDRIG